MRRGRPYESSSPFNDIVNRDMTPIGISPIFPGILDLIHAVQNLEDASRSTGAGLALVADSTYDSFVFGACEDV